jgi:cytochrome P450
VSHPADPIRDFTLTALPAEFYADPYPTYRALQTHDPVHRMPDGSLFLTRHRDLDAIYKDTTRFTSDKKLEFAPKYGADSLLFQHHTTSLVFNDPPLHTRVRRLIAGALNPRAIAAMEPGLVALVDHLLDAMQARGGADLIEDFASAIPIEIIGNLLNIPHAERAPLRDWSLAILGALEPRLTAQQQARGEQAVSDFLDYLRGLVVERTRHPGDPERDVLTRLIQGEAASGETLSEIELLQNCIFILNAGHETTTNLIGNGLELLLRYPDQRQRLIDDPALIEPAR